MSIDGAIGGDDQRDDDGSARERVRRILTVPVSAGRIGRSLKPVRLAASGAVRWTTAHLHPHASARARNRERAMMRTAEDVTRTMGEMKGAVMKLGQIISLMTGVVPDEVAAQLASLQANAPPMAYALVEQVFAAEFGAPPHKIFRRFEREPFAAASIGQVHRARLDDGTPVAVKVQYPGVREAITSDLANVGLMVGLVGVFSRALDAEQIVRDLKDGIAGELDYLNEAASQQRFFDAFDGHAFIRIPRVYHELTTPRVLTQEYLAGRPFSAALSLPQQDRDRVGEIIFRYAFGSIYRHALFNGDPHPGNYILLDGDAGPASAVAFVDYGCVTEFDAPTVEGFRRIIQALFAGDLEAWRAAVTDIGILRPDAPFSTEQLYDHMRWYWAPILEDEITFTPELAAEMVRRNTATTGEGGRINQWCNVPAGMVFLTRINFGLAGLL
ncbi:MAG TPA: AarF/ABC1/UbiB kinase family protein, partial [Dehalococcoidia bacterium]|nr:AarF/ABC1/UbiB kinase family protein [Dehalococcoidia bacterium]